MNDEEALVLLTQAALVDPRVKPSADAAEAWAAVLHRERLDECLEALRLVQRESSDWLHPAMVVKAVRRVRDTRERQRRVASSPARALPPAPLTAEQLAELARVTEEAAAAATAAREARAEKQRQESLEYARRKQQALAELEALRAP